MPSKNAMAIAAVWEGDLYSDEENRRDLAILIDKGVEKLVGAADALTYHDVGDELLGKEALEGWKVPQ